MPKEIAVYVGENGETANLCSRGAVVVYGRQQGKWHVLREKDFQLDGHLTMKDWRFKMAEIVDFMGECKTFVGLAITGIPYFELEKFRCSVWEFEGKPDHFLDYILEQEEAGQDAQAAVKSRIQPAPAEVFNGCYRISLKEIQEKNTGVTSKQVLLPFLRRRDFYSLEILCSHIPPWLELEVMSGNLDAKTEKINHNTIKITLMKECCGEEQAAIRRKVSVTGCRLGGD